MQTFPSGSHLSSLPGQMARAAAFVFLLFVPSLAQATPEYPVALDITVGTSCPYPNSRCLICHTTARGGQGTAVQPFAFELRQRGLTRGRDAALLQSALMALPDDWDSDEDGEPDKAELVRCGNPSGDDLGIGPEYGCDGARLAPSADGEMAGFFAAAVLVLGIAALRRRGSPRRTP